MREFSDIMGWDEPLDLPEPTFNMATFKNIPPFNGCMFFLNPNERQHDGTLEPPHVHIKLNIGKGKSKQKFWIAKPFSTEDREKMRREDTVLREFEVKLAEGSASPEILRDIVKHLNRNKIAVMKDWNDTVRRDYSDAIKYSLFPE